MPAEANDPRTILEEKEATPESNHEELAFALGRLLAWMIAAGKPAKVGKRAYVLCYKLRPDLIDGMTLEEIGRLCGKAAGAKSKRSDTHNLSKELSDFFGIRGLNDRGDKLSTERYRRNKLRQGRARLRLLSCSHLQVINQFERWRRKRPDFTAADRARICRDFGPIRRFLDAIHPLGNGSTQADGKPRV